MKHGLGTNTTSVVSDQTAGNLTWKLVNMVPHPRDGLNPGGGECNNSGRSSTTNQLATARDVYPRATERLASLNHIKQSKKTVGTLQLDGRSRVRRLLLQILSTTCSGTCCFPVIAHALLYIAHCLLHWKRSPAMRLSPRGQWFGSAICKGYIVTEVLCRDASTCGWGE